MENGELKSSVLIGGVLKTKWRLYGNSDLTMDQSQTQGFMPTEIQYSNTTSDQTIRINWTKQNDLWVPTHIRSSETHKSGLWTKSSFAKFDWRLGEDAKTINPKSSDILPEFMEQFAPFKLDRADENGNFVRGTEFVAPPDLFTDLEDAKQK